MAEKNDDIKNLFMNLGLNPSDYHEIRTAPSSNATVSEAPRRWSLLQAAAGKAAAAPATLGLGSSALPAAVPAPSSAPPADTGSVGSLSAALLAAAQDIARAETQPRPAVATPAALIVPAASAGVLPAALADAFVQSTPVDGLQSLFQSVKEPQTLAVMPLQGQEAMPTERRTDQLMGSAPVATPSLMSPAQRAAGMPSAAVASPVMAPMKVFMANDDEPVTRHAPPPASRLGPAPSPAAAASPPAVSPAPAPAAVQTPVATGAGRLRFASAAVEAAPVHGESLRDVFRRLSRDNRS